MLNHNPRSVTLRVGDTVLPLESPGLFHPRHNPVHLSAGSTGARMGNRAERKAFKKNGVDAAISVADAEPYQRRRRRR